MSFLICTGHTRALSRCSSHFELACKLACLPFFSSNIYMYMLLVHFFVWPPLIQPLAIMRLRETDLVLSRIVCCSASVIHYALHRMFDRFLSVRGACNPRRAGAALLFPCLRREALLPTGSFRAGLIEHTTRTRKDSSSNSIAMFNTEKSVAALANMTTMAE